jgi:hypothetical protein
VFEIAVACAGATSTAAYTAGVLDFLFEAFDEWERAKREAPHTVPHHQAIVRALVGTSGGGMALAIAAANATRAFEPVAAEDVEALLFGPGPEPDRNQRDAIYRLSANPLFATWVLGIDLIQGQDPLTGSPLPGLAAAWRGGSNGASPSLLNCEIIESLARAAVMVGKPGLRGAAKTREWIADPLEVRLTVTNLNGVPFHVSFGGARLTQTFLAARDEMAFAIETGGTRPADLAGYSTSSEACPPDCHFLDHDGDRNFGAWELFGRAAMATGALPIALETRVLQQPRDAYIWRTIRHLENGQISSHTPRWLDDGPDNQFLAVDGGFTHDPPFEYARQRLAGVNGRSPRDGGEANRGLILIDPLLGRERQRATDNLLASLLAMIMAPMEQSRMDASSVLTAVNERVYSRYMIAPRRPHPQGRELPALHGSEALVSAGVHAFLGFASFAYRAHDFMLGRRNAQKFLRDSLAVPDGNPILADGRWNERCLVDYRAQDDSAEAHYQVVPLTGSARIPAPSPTWPAGAINLDSRQWRGATKQLRKRLGAIGSDFARALAGDTAFWARPAAPFIMELFIAAAMIRELEAGVAQVNRNLPVG